jgi:uncharacterized membrane protein
VTAEPAREPEGLLCGRVRVRPAGSDGVVRVRVAPSPARVAATVAAESLAGWTVVGLMTLVARVTGDPGLLALSPSWWAAGAFLPVLALADALVFGQSEIAYVGPSTMALRPPLGSWYLLRRVRTLEPRYAPIERPWWSPQKELGQQGAGVILVGPEPVGVRFGNALGEAEALCVLEAFATVPVDLTFHEEVGQSPREVTVRIVAGLVIAMIAFALIFAGFASSPLAWLAGVGNLTLLWVAYRFWFNLFRRRPEYAA